MISAFECYRFYLGVKLHFTSEKYDVIQSKGKVSAKVTTFEKRRDRALFERLAEKFDRPTDAVRYFVANFAYGHNEVIYERDKGIELLTQWVKVKESLSKTFEDDLHTILDYAERNRSTYDETFYCTNGKICSIINLLKAGRISIQTVNLLSRFMPDLIDNWKQFPNHKLIFGDDLLRVEKLTPFIKVTDRCNYLWETFETDINTLQ